MTTDIIAIDGPAGSGKSTIAKAVAARLGWTYLDTGAMYRAVTAEALHRGIAMDDDLAIAELARTCTLTTKPSVTINGRDVTDVIRTSSVNEGVSHVAAIADVRAAMVTRQREAALAASTGVVVEGRDITTVVFPDATVKVFLTASLAERARRRGEEGSESIARRDEADATRAVSPLRQSDDAVVIDTTGLTIDEVVAEVIACHAPLSSN